MTLPHLVENHESALQSAEVCFAEGRFSEAESFAQQVLQMEPDNSQALCVLGNALRLMGRVADAIPCLTRLSALEPLNHEVHAALGESFMQTGDLAQAQKLLANAVLVEPDNQHYKTLFLQCLYWVEYNAYDFAAKEAMAVCLMDTGLQHKTMARAWLSMLLHDPSMKTLSALLTCETVHDFEQAFSVGAMAEALNDDFLTNGLKRTIIPHLPFERLFVRLRRSVLLEASPDEKQSLLPFLCGLATQCFFNEYVFDVSGEEQEKVEMLKGMKQLNLADMVLLGCYLPLYQWEGASAAREHAQDSGDADIAELVRVQIDEPFEEEALKKTLESFGVIEDEVSKAVQEQYEENPYPRWAAIAPVGISDDREAKTRGLSVLVAGCGTGHDTAITAKAFPGSDIVGVDLSSSSLAYALRKTQELAVSNIAFKQGDILKLAQMGKDFDFITCGGVLHHMDDPKAGLAVLKDVLKPDGVMRLELYSKIARRNIAACQERIKEEGYEATPEGIRAFRGVLAALPDDDPMKALTIFTDFYSLSECRDMLFHVQEHRFNCLEIKTVLDELDLDLLQFGSKEPGAKAQYQQMFPDDVAAVNLDNWHSLEENNPDLFRQMYALLVCKKGQFRPGETPEWLQGVRLI